MSTRFLLSVALCAGLCTACDETAQSATTESAETAETLESAPATEDAAKTAKTSSIAENVETVEKAEQSLEEKAWAQIAAGDILIDVRTQEEYDQGHLEHALLIPHASIVAGVEKAGIKSDQAIVVYCRSGGRAGRALKDLKAAGYTTIMNAGGYEKMRAAKPTVSK